MITPMSLRDLLDKPITGRGDLGLPDERVLRQAVAQLPPSTLAAGGRFWARLANWYLSNRKPWPPDGQIAAHWTPPQVNHFFWTARLNPHVVGAALEVEPGDVLAEMLGATVQGLLAIRWALLCSRCHQSAIEVPRLSDVPPEGSCELCQGPVKPDLATNVVATFTLHPSIHDPPLPNLPCPLPPPVKDLYLAEIMVGPGAECEFDVPVRLRPGEYVLWCPLTGCQASITVDTEAAAPPQGLRVLRGPPNPTPTTSTRPR